jgi:IS30 family transposase
MNDYQRILESLPPKPARSRLEPYSRLINELLRRGLGYREIALILAENYQTHVSISTIHDFVRLHIKPKQSTSRRHQTKVGKRVKVTTTIGAEDKAPSRTQNAESALDDVYARIADLKQRPAAVQKSNEPFHYDPDEPLNLLRNSSPDPAEKTN